MNSDVAPRRRVSPLAWLLIAPIHFYQRFITPYTPATCRYYPTCSAYAVGALRTHGAVKGTALTAWRLLRCNPWSHGGVDYPPERGSWRSVPTRYDDRATSASTGIEERDAATGESSASCPIHHTADPAAHLSGAATTSRRFAA